MPSYNPFRAPERAVMAAAPPTGMSLAPHLRYSSTAERGQRPRHPSLRHRLHTLCTIPPDSSRRLTFALCRRAAGTCVPDDLPGEPESAAANDAATMGTLSNVSVGADDGAVEALLRLLTRPQFLVPPHVVSPPPLRPRPRPSFRSQIHRRDRGPSLRSLHGARKRCYDRHPIRHALGAAAEVFQSASHRGWTAVKGPRLAPADTLPGAPIGSPPPPAALSGAADR